MQNLGSLGLQFDTALQMTAVTTLCFQLILSVILGVCRQQLAPNNLALLKTFYTA